MQPILWKQSALGDFVWSGAYEDEDDIEEILPLAFALGVFDASDVEIPLPSRFWLVYWIWKPSDWSATGQTELAQRRFGYQNR